MTAQTQTSDSAPAPGLLDAAAFADMTVETVIVPETRCRCGQRFAVLKVHQRPVPVILHTRPRCEAVDSMTGEAFVAWTRGQIDASEAAKPNRRQRRADAAKRRKT